MPLCWQKGKNSKLDVKTKSNKEAVLNSGGSYCIVEAQSA